MTCFLFSHARVFQAKFKARPGKNTGPKRCSFCPFCPISPRKSPINFVSQVVLLSKNIRIVNMKKLKCKQCPNPGGASKFLARLANHLAQVHELTELKRKYWIRFAKLQNTNAIRVYVKDHFFYKRDCAQLKLVSSDHGPAVETSLSCTYCWTYMLR